MVSVQQSPRGTHASTTQLVDRVYKMRRALAGLTSDNAHLRRELVRLRQTNLTLEQRLASGPRGRGL